MELENYLKLLDKTDIIIFVLIFLSNIVLWKKKLNSCLTYIFITILIGLILPLWSSGREVDRNIAINGPAMDNFELLYVYLIFPVYWLILSLEIVYIAIKPNPEIDMKNENILDNE